GNSKLFRISKIMRGFEIGRDKVLNQGDIKFITGTTDQKWKIKDYKYIDIETYNEYKKQDDFFEGERVLIRETGSNIVSLFLNEKLYFNRSLYSIVLTSEDLSAK